MNTYLKSLLVGLCFIITTPVLYAQSTWKNYAYPQASCSIDFPETPTTAKEGDVWTAQTKSENTIYQIVVYLNKQYAKSNAEAILTESLNGFINPATDQIEKVETLQVFGLPAKQVYVRSQDGSYLIFRTFVSDTKLYQLAIAGTNPAQTVSKSKKFLDSFKIQ